MLIPEDGCLPRITRSGLAPFNNVMIIKVPDKFQKPGETIYQFATLDRSKKGERWPADKYLDDGETESDKDDSSNDEDPLADSTEKEKVNSSKERSQIATKVNVNENFNYARLIRNKKKFEEHPNDLNPWTPSAVPLTFMDESNLLTSTDAHSFEKHCDTGRSLLGDYSMWKNSQINKDMGNSNPSVYPNNNLINRRHKASGCNDSRNFVEFESPYGISNMVEKRKYSNLSEGPTQMGHSNGPRNGRVDDNFKAPYQKITARHNFAGPKNSYENVRKPIAGPSRESYAGPSGENFAGPSRDNYVGHPRENYPVSSRGNYVGPPRNTFESTYQNSETRNPRAFKTNPQEKSYIGQRERNIHGIIENCEPTVDYGYNNMPPEDYPTPNNVPGLNYNDGFNGVRRDISSNFRQHPNNFQNPVTETDCFNDYNDRKRYRNQFQNNYPHNQNIENGDRPPFENTSWKGNQQPRVRIPYRGRGRGNNFRYQKFQNYRGRGHMRGRGNFNPPKNAI